ncbi:glycosyltransferase family 4 protein [Streptomyces sp. MBT97]|uniref:glycosyltransferase family 4 protein n=1 Tax=Streptomyces sp. MBT97 TaxID=2800411 RepID=UPI0019090616|nr:glycosyltransferase family 4 protein [Streptomyces sp. MBT97]MBK3632156.1 glycosyltransferase family 4 protein [Streptomyces sp. MBT97]
MAGTVFAPPSAAHDPARPGGTGHEAGDPLVAARTAFFDGSGWTAHLSEPRQDRRLPDAQSELAKLLEAEYGLPSRAVPPGEGPAVDHRDKVVAGLRRAARLGVPLAPEALLAHREGDLRLMAVLTELWPQTVRWHGPRHAEEVLRAMLGESCDGPVAGHLLDLAVAAGLHPLTPVESASLARTTTHRAVRHSAWRYLLRLPGGPAHVPGPSEAEDAYERLLLAPPVPVFGPERQGPAGLLVAQSMLLGALDTPGQGMSGGLAVLLGGLGDRLAATDGISGVITVVTAGHEDLAADDGLAHERAPGHWVLRLPVDAPSAPAQAEMHRHRAALTWWAVRLLGAMPRPLDVLHVRYADDGSLALADAAERLGAALVFTATPDPHRGLAERHAACDVADPAAAEALRNDLHRVFLADRLVERADTVVGIPGRGGTRELVRHFPGLARLDEGRGPSAPPEGIAPYRPAPDEDDRRREALKRLYRDGTHPGALDPGDRDLPVLLCVGRLHPVKQQDLLVRSWLATGAHHTTTLVLIGGSPGAGTAVEDDIRRRIDTLLAPYPQAARRLALLPALPNTEVRRLQRALAQRTAEACCWYVCPSAKEEFGIAVLEAMDAGLPVAGPRRGGVAHYLRDQVNGLLMDTSGQAGLMRGLRRIAATSVDDRRRYAAEGRKLVAERFSVTRMADELAAEYTALRTG